MGDLSAQEAHHALAYMGKADVPVRKRIVTMQSLMGIKGSGEGVRLFSDPWK